MSLRRVKYLNDDEQHAAKQRIETTDKRPVNLMQKVYRPHVLDERALFCTIAELKSAIRNECIQIKCR